ncbi:MAG: redoxin family protein [SAR324 cluster bacterium]|nr:redoxin family protein [SAR324 cluster bacterium]MCZ6557408.1 redoxin family protein [SAR324 cluster bacterium]MCZ6629620.1 redoxin family protein [SAR324 cluster bacterium]MCZ6647468.1 redoxin family protein [SAR324 cluster bacterium]MCZ6842622.1 redoxin family protein [SAR324 cluster bacterium]
MRSFPWVQGIEDKYASKGLQVIGIHTPEFSFEKARSRVEAAVKRYKIKHPVMMDNDYAYWNALDNSYWPAFYLVDKQGNIVRRINGEMHAGTGRADAVDELIQQLLDRS